MANSVVKVTDSMLNDSLLLLVGEDGTVTPDKEVVEAYLSATSGTTNLKVMHINKTDSQSIEVSVDNMLYVPDVDDHEGNTNKLDEIAQNLYNIKLDHDYTCHSKPEEVDELAKTLSILDGGEDCEFPDISRIVDNKTIGKGNLRESNVSLQQTPKSKPKLTNVQTKLNLRSLQKKMKVRPRFVKEKEEKDVDTGDAVVEEHDSDSEWEEHKQKRVKKVIKREVKSKPTNIKSPKIVKPEEPELTKLDKSPSAPLESKLGEKKPIKKEKKLPKQIPDFALFSTPDLIRRVGGKETNSPVTSPTEPIIGDTKPAKVETRSRSVSESVQTPVKQSRPSLDGKTNEKSPQKLENKNKEKKVHVSKIKRVMGDSPRLSESPIKTYFNAETSNSVEPIASASDVNLILNEEDKSLSNTLPLDSQDLSGNEHNIALDGTGLDLDPTLLENINNDLISEDILYQVAQSLVSNTELQNAIDKSLNEDNVLEHTTQVMDLKQDSVSHTNISEQESCSVSQKGTQIVRPDGRIVVIPPIERPTTRSRNKSRGIEKPILKWSHKPLDEEHVSGNELDSTEDEEEESEDDPNKLWCICNQPHNNRFMICCDTCEEWYHGKCVNITKAMGQQMESEGREWICLFCKDPLLRRPQAAARRIRKASRNSRQSSDSAGSNKVSEANSGSVPCVVCQKPSRSNSIFCTEACILLHAQGVERVVVFERSTGNMLTGNKAPSAANLEQWLKEHPGYEVVRSAGKIVTTKQPHNIGQSKFKITKSLEYGTTPLTGENKILHAGVLKHLSKHPQQSIKIKTKGHVPGLKVVSKHVLTSQQRDRSAVIRDSPISTPSKVKVVQSVIKSNTSVSREKSVTPKVQKVRQSEQVTPPAKQENIRDNIQKTMFEQLTKRLKMVDDLKLSEEEVKNISIEIESQLYKCFGDTGQKYRNKYRSLIFNIKDIKNQTLWRRICEKSINPYQLVRLSPDDLASQELALWREREAKHQLDMIKKSELELLKCNRQYVLKTHKGEQILEDNRPADNLDNSEAINSLTDGSAEDKTDHKRDTSKDSERRSSKHSHRDKERKSNREKNDNRDHSHRSVSKEQDRSRKRSRSRDKSSKHADRRRSKSRGRDRHRRSSHKSSRHKKDVHRGSSTDTLDKKSQEILEQLVDNKIVLPLEDLEEKRLWKHVSQEDILPTPVVESDSDNEPSSTVTIPTPPRSNELDEYMASSTVTESKVKLDAKERPEVEERIPSPEPKAKSEEIWRGVINMIDVAQISITAHEVSGDCHGLGLELPANLDIVGRISPDTVWDYIGKMKCSNSKIISVVRLNAINIEEKMPYLALYSYLSSRNRLGVVKTTNKAVKDFYILPLASQKPIPQALLPLNGPGFEEARPALLLGILVRDRRKRPSTDTLSPIVTSAKKMRIEVSVVQLTPPPRSYTPPPIKDPRLKLPLPPSDGDEPYSPEDSDPDSNIPSTPGENVPNTSRMSSSFLETDIIPSQTFQPFANKFDDIPGLDNSSLPSSTQEIQRQMEKLNKEIEMQKSEINSISQNIATASTEIGTSALANIALPSNLQQILDSIKTIGSAASLDALEMKASSSVPLQESSDFTIPLILPTNFSRNSISSTVANSTDNTIPLNLPSKKKIQSESDKTSVLSSLSEEDLIRKAEEMLEDSKKNIVKDDTDLIDLSTDSVDSMSGSLVKRSKVDFDQPPVPGLENEKI